VRSLPAILPYGPESAFHDLQDQLQIWLESEEKPPIAQLIEYARGEYRKLSHGTVSCTPDELGPEVPR
jgi:hypothetical protein